MPNVPTAAITHGNLCLSLMVGQAKPCRSEPYGRPSARLLQGCLPQTSIPRLEIDIQALESGLAVLDFPIVLAMHSPRLG